MRKKVLTVLEIFFILVFIFSVAQIIRIVNNYKKGDAIYETAKTYVEDTHEKDGDKEEYYFTIDLKSLKEINPEVMGWIRIPDTPIDYPLLQGTDNKYYLKHTYDNQYSDFGSIFLDHRCVFLDSNTVIYGHNTRNGSMFGSLKEYKDSEYLEKHPYVYVLYGNVERKYRIIALLTVDTSNPDPAYALNKGSDANQKKWLEEQLAKSEIPQIKTDEITGKEKILTLSTCTSRIKTERLVIMAEEVGIVWEK
ncbi:MAG: class B sortase [Clostridia bacterium]|nr:class B sortase [Clostridia bacterium]